MRRWGRRRSGRQRLMPLHATFAAPAAVRMWRGLPVRTATDNATATACASARASASACAQNSPSRSAPGGSWRSPGAQRPVHGQIRSPARSCRVSDAAAQPRRSGPPRGAEACASPSPAEPAPPIPVLSIDNRRRDRSHPRQPHRAGRDRDNAPPRRAPAPGWSLPPIRSGQRCNPPSERRASAHCPGPDRPARTWTRTRTRTRPDRRTARLTATRSVNAGRKRPSSASTPAP
jgi:hypothetical protein